MEKIWQKSYVKGVPTSLKFQDITLPEALSRTVIRFPETPALIFQGTVMNFRDLEDKVERFASALVTLGVKPGQKISIILPNLIQTAIAIHAAMRVGAIVVMHNPRNDDMQLEYQINNAGSEIAICLDVLVPRIGNLRKKTNITKIVSCHIRDYLPFLKKQLFPIVKKNLHLKTPDETDVYEFTDLLENSSPLTRIHKATLEDTAVILYTSATTGKPKGVELTHGNLSKNVQQVRSWFPTFLDGKEIVIACLPFFHVFGLTCALNIGAFYGYGNVLIPLPEPKEILQAIQDSKATFIPALPSFYTALMSDPSLTKYNLKSLKGCFSGGAPLPLEVIRSFEKLTGVQICEGYGLTESSPVSHINPFQGKTKVGTIGLPLPETDAKIVDLNDFTKTIAKPGEPGELCIKGPQIMKGYVNLPDKTEEALKDGWLLTGDIAVMDEEGYFTVIDRKKDLIISQGRAIYPRDVDEVLFSHPKILEACALGVPDPEIGQCVKAFVVLKKGEKATAAEIIDFCASRLPEYKVPRLIQFVNELPKSPVGKILRKELRRLHFVQASSPKVQQSS